MDLISIYGRTLVLSGHSWSNHTHSGTTQMVEHTSKFEMRALITHVFGAYRCLQVLRDWVRDALQHIAGWAAPVGGGELLHLVYGRESHTAVDG